MPERATRRSPGRPRRAARETGSSRAELVEAAAVVFAERGYQAASVDEVIRRARLSKGTFYFNFASKEDLFLAVIKERLDDPAHELMQITASAAGNAPTSGAVSAGLAELFRNERDTLMLLQEYWSHAARDDQLAARYRTRQAWLRDALAHALEQRHQHTGVPLTFDAHRLAQAFIALGQGLALESIVDPDAVDDELFGDVLALVYGGLVARATSSTSNGNSRSV